MGLLQQGAPPHLYPHHHSHHSHHHHSHHTPPPLPPPHHHAAAVPPPQLTAVSCPATAPVTAAVLFSTSGSGGVNASTMAGGGGGGHGLPSLTTDVSEFFSQLENPDDDSVGVALSSFLQQAESKCTTAAGGGRFHPYESSRPSPSAYRSANDDVMMEGAGSPGGDSYAAAYGGQTHFSEGGSGLVVYHSGGQSGSDSGYVFSSGGGAAAEQLPVPDQSGEDIWDLDSHTVRRYNPPVPDPVSPGPIPTTPTMYGMQGKAGWEPGPPSSVAASLYPQYHGSIMASRGAAALAAAQVLPPQAVSPGIGGPWIGGASQLSLNKGSVMTLGGGGAAAVDTSKRPKSYQCEACDKWFTSSGHLKRHFNTTLHKNAMKQKGGGGGGGSDSYLDGGLGSSYSIPSVESRGAPSPCMSLGEESSQSCDEASSQSSQVSLTPVSTPGPLQQAAAAAAHHHRPPPVSPPLSTSSPYVPNDVSSPSQNHHHHLLSPPPSSVGVSDSASSPLSGLSQLVGGGGPPPPSTPQPPSMSPLTPGSVVSMSPNGNNLPGSPAHHRNRYSPFRGGPPPLTTSANLSYKVQSLDMRGYSSYPTTFQAASQVSSSSIATSAAAASHAFNNAGDVYMSSSPQSSYRSDGGGGYAASTTSYTGQYQAQYQPLLYNTGSSYAMVGSHHHHHHHHQAYLGPSSSSSASAYSDISAAGYMPADSLHLFTSDSLRTLKGVGGLEDERDSPEGSDESDMSLKNEHGEFRCNECNKVFNKICYLKQHNKSFHNGEKPFKCSQCGKRFPVEVLYQEHLAKHAGDKPYKCEVCPKQFNHKTDLRRHMCLHTGEKPFSCDVCGKGFIREDRMVKHADTHKKKAAHVGAGGLM